MQDISNTLSCGGMAGLTLPCNPFICHNIFIFEFREMDRIPTNTVVLAVLAAAYVFAVLLHSSGFGLGAWTYRSLG